jgi:hypothetical protein
LADLSPLSSLDQLQSLNLPEPCDLRPLSRLRLTTLVIDSGSRPILDLTIDLDPLAEVSTLERFATPYRTRNVSALLANPDLRRLGLRAADAEELAAAGPALALNNLDITDALNRDLSFVAAWPSIVDLRIDDGLLLLRDRLLESAEACPPDLRPVGRLPFLRVLRLWGARFTDLSGLMEAHALRELYLHGQGMIDLTDLAGRRSITVSVPPRARVLGAEKLGPDSKLVRRGL